jgi:predicted nucleotidyltransferase
MNKQEIITEYKNLLKVKKANIYSVDKRRIKDLHKFYKGEKEPKDILLNYFFNWLEENDNKIDAIILFGSYCKGIETNESFNRHKHLGKEKLLSFGPSDIDAIIIYNSELQLPNYLAEYKIINESFEIIGIQKLNLFRDLIIIPLEGIKTALLQHKPEYVAGYLYSYYKMA